MDYAVVSENKNMVFVYRKRKKKKIPGIVGNKIYSGLSSLVGPDEVSDKSPLER